MLEQKNITGQIDAKFLSRIKIEDKVLKINAEEMHYKDLNCLLRSRVKNKDIEKIESHNVCGQRYIGTDLDSDIQIDVYGTPGNDLGAFMSGPKLTIHGNAQDASGNTMNEGKMVIHGACWRLNWALDAWRKNLRPRLRRLPSRHPHEAVSTQNTADNYWTNNWRLFGRVHGRRYNSFAWLKFERR